MRRLPRTLVGFSILTLLYLLLGIALPPNSPTLKAYHLSVSQYHILVLLVSIPLIAVWFAAFYGYDQLEEYAALVKKAPDGPPLARVALGLKWLAWGLPVSSIITTVLGGIVHGHPALTSSAFIIVHYVPVVVSLLAFYHISTGTHSLVSGLQSRIPLSSGRWLLGGLTILGVLFSYITTQASEQTPNPYRLPVWLILLTIVAPYLYAWFMGLIGAYELYFYSRNTKGVLYQRSLQLVAYGMSLAILGSVVLQYIQSDTTHLRRIDFNPLFAIVYAVLLLYAIGFLLISQGVKKLRRIEEV